MLATVIWPAASRAQIGGGEPRTDEGRISHVNRNRPGSSMARDICHGHYDGDARRRHQEPRSRIVASETYKPLFAPFQLGDQRRPSCEQRLREARSVGWPSTNSRPAPRESARLSGQSSGQSLAGCRVGPSPCRLACSAPACAWSVARTSCAGNDFRAQDGTSPFALLRNAASVLSVGTGIVLNAVRTCRVSKSSIARSSPACPRGAAAIAAQLPSRSVFQHEV